MKYVLNLKNLDGWDIDIDPFLHLAIGAVVFDGICCFSSREHHYCCSENRERYAFQSAKQRLDEVMRTQNISLSHALNSHRLVVGEDHIPIQQHFKVHKKQVQLKVWFSLDNQHCKQFARLLF